MKRIIISRAARVAATANPSRGLVAAVLLCASPVAALAGTLELGDPQLFTGEETTSSKLAVSLKNAATEIVGVQFDLVYADGLASPGIPSLPESDTEHKLDVRLIEPGRYRVLLFSPGNKPLGAPYSIDLRFGFTEESPEGGPAMRLENIYLAGADGKLVPVTLAYGPIGSWRNDNFTEAEWNDKQDGGDTGDADGDGLPNLQEFYFDTDPGKGDGSAAAAAVGGVSLPDGSGGKILRLTWRERKDVTGVKAVVAGGTDPANMTNSVPVDVSSEDATFRQLQAEAAAGGAAAYFLELRTVRE